MTPTLRAQGALRLAIAVALEALALVAVETIEHTPIAQWH